MPAINRTTTKGVIDTVKDISEHPEDAEKIINESGINEHNVTDVYWYLDQTRIMVQDTQNGITEFVSNNFNIPVNVAQPIGTIIPITIVLLWVYIILKSIVKNLKVVAVLLVIVTLAYIYFSVG